MACTTSPDGRPASNHRFPDGVGIYLESGDVIVNQIHYHFDHETPPDQSTIVLQTATSDEVATGLRRDRGSAYDTRRDALRPRKSPRAPRCATATPSWSSWPGCMGRRLRTCPTP